jgi:hypothetical protein
VGQLAARAFGGSGRVGLLHDRDERLLASPARLEEARDAPFVDPWQEPTSLSATVAGLRTRLRPTPSYTTLWDVTFSNLPGFELVAQYDGRVPAWNLPGLPALIMALRT